MKHTFLYLTILFVATISLASCGQSAEDISYGFDHEVPQYKVLTDSLVVDPLQGVTLIVEVSDNVGLKRLEFSYSDWKLMEAHNISDSPRKLTFETSIHIPIDAEKVWQEKVTQNDGTIVTITQTYHRLTLLATDVNQNVRRIPIYIKVR